MLITLATDPGFHERVAARVDEAGLQGELQRAMSVTEIANAVDTGLRPDVVIGGTGVSLDELCTLAEKLRTGVPHCIVLAVAVPTTATLRAALRAGVRDVLTPSFTATDLADALAATGFGRTPEITPLPGRTIAVFSAKGGVGTSVLASNLALRLAELTGAPTVLADCDLASADQTVLHGLRPRYTLQDVADGAVDQDTESLEQVLLAVPDTKVRVLAGPMDPAAAEAITDDAVLHALRRLRQLVGLVVVDTASAFTDATLTVLEHADLVVLPVSLDVLSLRALVVTLQTFERLGISRDDIRVVVVRSDAKVGLTVDDVVRTAGVEVSVAVPSSRDVARSVNTATPLALHAPRSTVVRAVDELARLVVDGVEVHGADEPVEENRRRRLPRFRGENGEAAVRQGAAAAAPTLPPGLGTAVAPAASTVVDEAAPAASVADVGAPDTAPPVSDVATAEAAGPRPPTRRKVLVRSSQPVPEREDAAVAVGDEQSDRDPAGEDGANIIALAAPHERLAAMPPPRLDPDPSSSATDDGRRRRGRRSARS